MSSWRFVGVSEIKRKRKNTTHHLNISAAKIQLEQICRQRIRAWEKRSEISTSSSCTSSEIFELLNNSGKFPASEIREIKEFIELWQQLHFGEDEINPEALEIIKYNPKLFWQIWK